MKILNHIKPPLFIIILAIFAQCSKDGESVKDPIVMDYPSNIFQVEFRSEGSTSSPTVDWSGEKGSFAFKFDVDGLKINSKTGEISWERNLAIGEHEVIVVGQNSKDKVEKTLVFENLLKDSFWSGGQNNDFSSDGIILNRQLWLFEDGTLEVEILGEAESKGIGVWSINGDAFSMHLCIYCEDINPLDVPNSDEHSYYEGTLVNEELTASISGQWYVIRFDPDSRNLRGNFHLEWD